MLILPAKSFDAPVVLGDESLMSKKAHGTTENPPQKDLLFGVSWKTADKVRFHSFSISTPLFSLFFSLLYQGWYSLLDHLFVRFVATIATMLSILAIGVKLNSKVQ